MIHAYRMPSPLAGLKEAPSRLLVGKWGRNPSIKGDFTVNERTAKLLPALQKALGFDTVSLDFEHNTLPGTDAFKADKEPRNIAATGRPVVVPGEGLYLEDLKWTPHGVKSITEGLHPDLSPTIKSDDDGNVLFLHSAALCRQGCAPDLQAFAVDGIFTAAQLTALSATVNPSRQPSALMDYKKLLTIILGLQANASDTEIETAAQAFADKIDKAGKAAALTDHSATITKLGDQVKALETKLAGQERAALVAAAIAAGKMVPHGAEIDKLDNAAFKAVLDTLPAGVVPLAQRTPDGLKAHGAAFSTDPASEAVRKQFGISADRWGKDPKESPKAA